jgi:hypothetical protein
MDPMEITPLYRCATSAFMNLGVRLHAMEELSRHTRTDIVGALGEDNTALLHRQARRYNSEALLLTLERRS